MRSMEQARASALHTLPAVAAPVSAATEQQIAPIEHVDRRRVFASSPDHALSSRPPSRCRASPGRPQRLRSQARSCEKPSAHRGAASPRCPLCPALTHRCSAPRLPQINSRLTRPDPIAVFSSRSKSLPARRWNGQCHQVRARARSASKSPDPVAAAAAPMTAAGHWQPRRAASGRGAIQAPPRQREDAAPGRRARGQD